MFTHSSELNRKLAAIETVIDDNDTNKKIAVRIEDILCRIDRELEIGQKVAALGVCDQAINAILTDERLSHHPRTAALYIEAVRAKIQVIQTMCTLNINQMHHAPTNDEPGTKSNPIRLT